MPPDPRLDRPPQAPPDTRSGPPFDTRSGPPFAPRSGPPFDPRSGPPAGPPADQSPDPHLAGHLAATGWEQGTDLPVPLAATGWERESDLAGQLPANRWREGTTEVGSVRLESGAVLPAVTVAYETWGALNRARSNAILVEHALTGDSHVIGPPTGSHPTIGWWDGMIGPGKWIDTDEWFVVASNVLGGCQGTTGPRTPTPDGRPWGSRFPFITVRDQVQVEARLADELGIDSWASVVGGSMGGMRALEWAVMYPSRVQTAVVLASTGYASAEQIAWCRPQTLAIRQDPHFHGGDYYDQPCGPVAGLGLARRIAQVTYRSEHELAARFGRGPQQGEHPFEGGRYAIESYLDHHADKLVTRFDANSYLVLTEAMSSHDIGRSRGGMAAALARFPGRLVLAAVDSDRLYPPYLSEELARERGTRRSDGVQRGEPVAMVRSEYGHDGFLIEIEQVGQLLRRALHGLRLQHSCA